MSISFQSNSGTTITGSFLDYDNDSPNWRGLHADEPIPTFINLNAYIQSSWVDSFNSDVFGRLRDLKDISSRTEDLEYLKANSAFVWGNENVGGLCVFKTSSTTLGIKLFYGHGVSESEPTKDKYWIESFWSNQQIKSYEAGQFFIGEGRTLGGNPEYGFYYPAVNQGGVGKCREVSPIPEYKDPLDDTRITDCNFLLSNVYYRLDEILVTSEYLTIKPLVGDNYTIPVVMAHYEDIGNTSFWHDFEEPEGYTFTGTWYGGTDNKVDLDPNSSSGHTSTGGGYGTPSNDSGQMDFPPDSQFSVDAFNSGLLTAFMPTKDEIKAFNDFLYNGITESISLVIKRLTSNPMDFIISLGMVHYLPSLTITKEIKFAGHGSGVFAPVVEHQFHTLDCGTIDVAEQFKTFLDYTNYSRFKIYLPYIGTQLLSADDIMKSSVHLKYIIDNASGNCVALVKVTRNKRCEGDANDLNDLLYRFTGNCLTQVPLTSTDWRNFFSGAVSTLGGVVSVASGNFAGVGAIANGVMSMKPDVQKSGSLQTDFGFMDNHTPYLILERPIQAVPQRFNEYRGYVSNITRKLSSCSKFTKVSDSTIWTNNIKCTDDEMEEIKQLCYEGVWI